jgi:hypothetical protein
MTGQTCSVCGTTLSSGGRGRPSVYCSRACQAKAYRDRRSARSDGERGESARTARTAAAELAAAALGLVELVEATEAQPEAAAARQATAQRALDTLMGLALAARDETPSGRDKTPVRSAPVLPERTAAKDVDQAAAEVSPVAAQPAAVVYMREDLIGAGRTVTVERLTNDTPTASGRHDQTGALAKRGELAIVERVDGVMFSIAAARSDLRGGPDTIEDAARRYAERVPARYVPTAEKSGPREEIPETVTQSTAPPAKRSLRAVGRPGEDTGEGYEVVRSPSYDTTGTWDVIADGNRVGQVRPLHRVGGGKAWTAHGPSGVAITVGAGKGGGYRTRNAAAVQVLITHRIMERNRKEKRARDRRIAKFDTEQGGANR